MNNFTDKSPFLMYTVYEYVGQDIDTATYRQEVTAWQNWRLSAVVL